jgi:hypothetical protein
MERLVAVLGRLQFMINDCIERMEPWLGKLEAEGEACPERIETCQEKQKAVPEEITVVAERQFVPIENWKLLVCWTGTDCASVCKDSLTADEMEIG